VSKQLLAVLVMQQVDAGTLALDTGADRYQPDLKRGGRAPTLRELLQHRSGLRNPDDSDKDARGQPGFYTGGQTGLAWCIDRRKAPGGDWRYNNCDSFVLGAVLERVTGKRLPELFEERIAQPLRLNAARYIDHGINDRYMPMFRTRFAEPPDPQERHTLVRYGPAGGLVGPARDLLAIDRALVAGRLMSPAARDAMWAGDPKLGYMALAQWSFSAPLKGCAAPVRIVERRGGIGRYQVRNIILPDADRHVILFTADGDFDFGEIWQGRGLSHDLLAAAACP
jgi:D-alanyl-D-alanine carboxypeptidase